MDVVLTLFVMFLGVLAATFMPYVRKMKEGKILGLDMKYIWHMVLTAAWQFIIGIGVFTLWSPSPDIVGDAFILVSAFAFGYGGNEFQKEAEKWIQWLRG